MGSELHWETGQNGWMRDEWFYVNQHFKDTIYSVIQNFSNVTWTLCAVPKHQLVQQWGIVCTKGMLIIAELDLCIYLNGCKGSVVKAKMVGLTKTDDFIDLE